jgi:hypothetical protein
LVTQAEIEAALAKLVKRQRLDEIMQTDHNDLVDVVTLITGRLPSLGGGGGGGATERADIADFWAEPFWSLIPDKPDIPTLPITRSNVSDFFDEPFWSNIPDVPLTFPPSAHEHVRADISDFWSADFWSNIPDKPDTYPPSAHVHSAEDITSDILSESIGGLGKELDLTGLTDGYVIYYDDASGKFKVKLITGGGGLSGLWQNCVCYPWAQTAVLSDDPLYDYTAEVSDNSGSLVPIGYFDFDLPVGTIKSIFANLIFAVKITGAGNGTFKWQLSKGTNASPVGYVDITDTFTETSVNYNDRSRSGVIHKITSITTDTPFTVRAVMQKGTATSVEGKIKCNTYFRVTYKVT